MLTGVPFCVVPDEHPMRIHSRTLRGMHPGPFQFLMRLRSSFVASHSLISGSGDVGGLAPTIAAGAADGEAAGAAAGFAATLCDAAGAVGVVAAGVEPAVSLAGSGLGGSLLHAERVKPRANIPKVWAERESMLATLHKLRLVVKRIRHGRGGWGLCPKAPT